MIQHLVKLGAIKQGSNGFNQYINGSPTLRTYEYRAAVMEREVGARLDKIQQMLFGHALLDYPGQASTVNTFFLHMRSCKYPFGYKAVIKRIVPTDEPGYEQDSPLNLPDEFICTNVRPFLNHELFSLSFDLAIPEGTKDKERYHGKNSVKIQAPGSFPVDKLIWINRQDQPLTYHEVYADILERNYLDRHEPRNEISVFTGTIPICFLSDWNLHMWKKQSFQNFINREVNLLKDFRCSFSMATKSREKYSKMHGTKPHNANKCPICIQKIVYCNEQNEFLSKL